MRRERGNGGEGGLSQIVIIVNKEENLLKILKQSPGKGIYRIFLKIQNIRTQTLSMLKMKI